MTPLSSLLDKILFMDVEPTPESLYGHLAVVEDDSKIGFYPYIKEALDSSKNEFEVDVFYLSLLEKVKSFMIRQDGLTDIETFAEHNFKSKIEDSAKLYLNNQLLTAISSGNYSIKKLEPWVKYLHD